VSKLGGLLPNHFSLALKHFLINLKLVPGDLKNSPFWLKQLESLFFHFSKIYEQKTFQ
jgi:hypothetical protein